MSSKASEIRGEPSPGENLASEGGSCRPWGYYRVLAEDDRYKIKRIVLCPGGRTSLQTHELRGEHWYVVSGAVFATCGDVVRELAVGQYIDIPRGVRHRLENRRAAEAVLIEIQSGDYFGEDDIRRIDDDYGRT